MSEDIKASSAWVAGTETSTDKDKPSTPLGRGDAWLTALLSNPYLGWAALVIAILAPFVYSSPYAIGVMTTAALFVMEAAGLNIVVGYCGLLDLGYVAFVAIGAYTGGVLATRAGWPILATIPAVIVTSIIAGLIIGGPTLRLRSDYLAIVTLGFGEIIRLTANNLSITGGPSGIYGIPSVTIFGEDLSPHGNPIGFYFLCLVIVSLAVLCSARLGRGRLGRAWRFVREDEDAAEAMGIQTYQVKLAAYVIGAIFGGIAGMLTGVQLTAISPPSFVFLQSALLLMAVVLGGMGSVPGIVVGAVFISVLPELLRGVDAWRYFIFGVLLIVAMIFRPQGLWPHVARERDARGKRSDQDEEVTA